MPVSPSSLSLTYLQEVSNRFFWRYENWRKNYIILHEFHYTANYTTKTTVIWFFRQYSVRDEIRVSTSPDRDGQGSGPRCGTRPHVHFNLSSCLVQLSATRKRHAKIGPYEPVPYLKYEGRARQLVSVLGGRTRNCYAVQTPWLRSIMLISAQPPFWPCLVLFSSFA